ncbi:MAG: dTDP-4-dehydrorhamnose reductase [Defluviitaleaceae bacterium]|nr:dTDP-4-dehydrorhamnose reductase [Defluviitaleaceae bacterium]
MKHVLVTGSTGQLGHDVIKALKEKHYQPIAPSRHQMDLTNNDAIRTFLMRSKPDAIIHCGAYTAVDQAEIEHDICYQINATATKILATYAKAQQIPFVYISTDYVFDGTKEGAYVETDVPNPINIYGATKLKGEQHVSQLLTQYFIVRISWVFGLNGHNFIKSMLRLSETHDELSIVADQVGAPTATADLAPLLVNMLESDKYGLYHVTNEGFCSWFDFAKEIFDQFDIEIKLNPISSADFPTRAKRPMNSQMNQDHLIKAGFIPLPPWQEALKNWRIAYEKLAKT